MSSSHLLEAVEFETVALADDAEPRECCGAIAVWSANAPPAPLGA
jgi:hypothetical protein